MKCVAQPSSRHGDHDGSSETVGDPADATGDDERHPDECTEPPDKPEGMGWRDGKQRVEEVEAAEVGMLRVQVARTTMTKRVNLGNSPDHQNAQSHLMERTNQRANS